MLCEDPTQVTFDFIIVGAGSAGATAAARLSEIPEWNVLLLEAGGDPPDLIENPILWNHFLRTEYDWTFLTEKNPYLFKGMERERCIISRGLALGGSSTTNAMIYLRGTVEDFTNWENYYGCHGWGYEDVLRYFKKSEDFVDNSRFNPEIHSRTGPLTVSPLQTVDPVYKVVIEAETSLNLNRVEDLNRKEPAVVGFGDFDSTTRKGRRCGTFKAFLLPASNRPNFFVAKNIIVTRIVIIDGAAVGVEFSSRSTKESKYVFCTKEVILSAGPVKSPQILMLSGIGPKEHLDSLNIPVVKDLQVGFNVQDHMSIPALVFTDRKYRPKEEIIEESTALRERHMRYYSEGIATVGLSKIMTFHKSKPELEYPDLQILKFRVPYNATNKLPNKKKLFSNMFGYAEEVTTLYDQLNLLSDIIVMVPILLKPSSTGRIMLNSTDPFDDPKIFANYLSSDEEKNALISGIEFVVQLSKTKIMTDYGLVLEELKLPNCVDYIWGTRDYWLCAIQNIAAPFYHIVGSCKMGPKDDCQSVVDPSLNVKGIIGLRVMDSSVMPKIVSVNPNAASIMIGEKGSDMIKECYGKLR